VATTFSVPIGAEGSVAGGEQAVRRRNKHMSREPIMSFCCFIIPFSGRCLRGVIDEIDNHFHYNLAGRAVKVVLNEKSRCLNICPSTSALLLLTV
jgi:hypothetical protein